MYRAIGSNGYLPVDWTQVPAQYPEELDCSDVVLCPAGQTCAGDGRCVPLIELPPDEITGKRPSPSPGGSTEFVYVKRPSVALPIVIAGALVAGAAFYFGTRS